MEKLNGTIGMRIRGIKSRNIVTYSPYSYVPFRVNYFIVVQMRY